MVVELRDWLCRPGSPVPVEGAVSCRHCVRRLPGWLVERERQHEAIFDEMFSGLQG